MHKLITKYAIRIALVLAIVIGFIALIDHFDRERTEKKTTPGNKEVVRHALDSVATVSDMELIKRKDSTIQAERTKADKAIKERDLEAKKTNQLEKERNRLLLYYKCNPTLSSCDSVLKKDSAVISSQKIQIDSLISATIHLNKSNIELLSTCVIKDTINSRAIRERDYYMKVTSDLRGQIKKDNNWFRRNEKWIFFISGGFFRGLLIKR